MVYLMQIPGLGLIFSMVVLSAIGDINRFSHPRKLVGYAGLGAGVHISGEKYQEKSITKAGRKELRWALVEAAWVAVRFDPFWKAQYQAAGETDASATKPLWQSREGCWFRSGTSSPNGNPIVTSMRRPLPTRC